MPVILSTSRCPTVMHRNHLLAFLESWRRCGLDRVNSRFQHPGQRGREGRSLEVDAIITADLMNVLTPIWTCKAETASRVRQRMETVMDWAVAQGYRLDNPAGRSLLRGLPKTQRLKEHHQALRYAQVPGAVMQVRESNETIWTKLAFEYLVLTAGRSGEVWGA